MSTAPLEQLTALRLDVGDDRLAAHLALKMAELHPVFAGIDESAGRAGRGALSMGSSKCRDREGSPCRDGRAAALRLVTFAPRSALTLAARPPALSPGRDRADV